MMTFQVGFIEFLALLLFLLVVDIEMIPTLSQNPLPEHDSTIFTLFHKMVLR